MVRTVSGPGNDDQLRCRKYSRQRKPVLHRKADFVITGNHKDRSLHCCELLPGLVSIRGEVSGSFRVRFPQTRGNRNTAIRGSRRNSLVAPPGREPAGFRSWFEEEDHFILKTIHGFPRGLKEQRINWTIILPGRVCTNQDSMRYEVRELGCYNLRHEAAKRPAARNDLPEVQRVGEILDIVGELEHVAVWSAAGQAKTAVVKDNDLKSFGQSIKECGIPIVQYTTKAIREDYGSSLSHGAVGNSAAACFQKQRFRCRRTNSCPFPSSRRFS